ncbi:hypothetical protein, partial [Frankia sp. Cr1]|uniref:hypothetical protein n=1 Tax=Frankia sp. Cr1 TaxID=3073931 RepID=UPI002AD1EF04
WRRAVVTGLICSPLVFGWAWWMQYFLLGGALVGATLYQRRATDHPVYPGTSAPTGPIKSTPIKSTPTRSARDGPESGSRTPT